LADSGHEPDIKPFMIIDADKQIEFAQHLFSNQKYDRAISEFQRFIYFFPQDDRVEPAMYRIGEAYFNSRRYTEAVDSFQTLIDRFGETDLGVKSYLMISESHMQLNASGQAIINLQNLITVTADENIKDEAYYRIGWIYLETANWEKARHYFSKISAQNRPKYKLKRLSADLDRQRWIPQKNPRLAGFLSIIPGGGFLYCERYQDALVAFLLNGALMLAAYESFDDDNNALGGVLSVVEFGFYAGNIYGAVAGAHKYNRTKTTGFIEKLKTKHKISLSADLQNKGACLALKFAF
jgi:tetratricopeptide (TPR) repeat protein